MLRPPDACPIPCNLCGASDIEVLSLRDRRGGYLRTTICRRCGLVWTNPRPPEDTVRQYYAHQYRLDHLGQITPSLRLTARSGIAALYRCRALRPHLSRGDAILDVGAGGGELVYMLRRLGFDAQGIEPDTAWAAYARHALGVPVQTAFMQSVSFPAPSFTVVTLYHVLEHLEDPAGAFAIVAGWIAARGLLLVEVPNVEATCHAPRRRFHFAHLHSFNDATLCALGRRAGFEPVQTRTTPDGSLIECLFRYTGDIRAVTSIPGNCERITRVVANHQTLAHYLTSTPYRRVFRRLRSYRAMRRAIDGCAGAAQVLDGLLAGAEEDLPPSSR